MKKSDGFTLIEVLISFTLLIVVSAATLPILMIFYQERITIEEERRNLRLLREIANHYNIGNEIEHISEDVRISFERPGVIKLCVDWTGANGRFYEHCVLASK